MTRPLQHLLAGDHGVGAAVDTPPAPPAWLLLADDPDATVQVVGESGDADLGGVDVVAGGQSAASPGLIVCGTGVTASDLEALVSSNPAASVVLLPGAPRPGARVRVLRLASAPAAPAAQAASAASVDPSTDHRVGVAIEPPSHPGSSVARALTRAKQIAGRDVAPPSASRVLRVVDEPAAPSETVVLRGGRGAAVLPAYLADALGAGATMTGVRAPDHERWHQAAFLVEHATGGLLAHVAASVRARQQLRHHADVLEALVGRAHVSDVVPRVVDRRVLRRVDLVVETRLPGQRLGDVASATPTGPALGAGLEALHRLAGWTATRSSDLAPALSQLVDALVGVGVEREVTAQLMADVETVARTSPPAVLVHGRPGPWSLVVHDGHRIGFADWRDAELAGPPVWDLTELLLRTLDEWQRRRGRSTDPAVLAHHLLEKGDWHHRLARELTRACGELGFPSSAGWALVRLALAARVVRRLPALHAREVPADDAVRLLGEAVRLTAPRE